MTITDGLDAGQRDALERLVVRGRTTLEDDLASQAEGRFGIRADGTIEDEDNLHLDATAAADRREMVEVVKHLRALGETPAGAAARFLREAAFTHLNRLVAIRIAEAIGLLPESLAHGRQSAGFKQVQEVAPLLAGDYWSYLRLCGDELAVDAPALFDPRNPLLALGPSPSALEKLVEALADEATVGIWLAPDTLGWVYQFFNSPEERRGMREDSPAPRNSRELAVRNQFFTPRYVVDFLVQNTLGRRLVETDPTTPLLADLPLLVDPPDKPGFPLDLAEVRVLDPACGSGHFLLGCYDLLEKAWSARGIRPMEAAPRIVASLWGVDIDSRCAQVASAALVLRARRNCRDLPLPRPHITTARALPGGPALPHAADLASGERRLVRAVSDVLADAPVLGTLLKVEEAMEREIRHSAFSGLSRDGTLPLADEAFVQEESNLRVALQRLAHDAASTVAERLFAAEADDALRFVDACRNRYDAVLMNPPFGLPVPATADYLRSLYGVAGNELYACFVERGLELLNKNGYLGAITNRTGFFLSTLEEWRTYLLERGIVTFADLGSFVLEGAQVEVAAYVAGQRRPETVFIRCLLSPDKQGVLRNPPPDLVFRIPASLIDQFPSRSFAYWSGRQLLELFSAASTLETEDRIVSRGLSAGDNFRFIRAVWEIPPSSRSSGWVPLAKGGEYSPFYDDIHLLLDWRSGPQPYSEVGGARIFNLHLQGHSGVCWPKRTTSLPTGRPLPSGCFFEANSIPVIAHSDLTTLLSWTNSRIFHQLFLMQVGAGDTARGSAAKDWITGPARRLPYVKPIGEQAKLISGWAEACALARRELLAELEVSLGFRAPSVLVHRRESTEETFSSWVETAVRRRESVEARLLTLWSKQNTSWLEVYEADPETVAVLDRELEPDLSSYSSAFPRTHISALRTGYLTMAPVSLEQSPHPLADSRAESRIGSQVEHRTLSDLCRIFRVTPEALTQTLAEERLFRTEQKPKAARDIVSYLLGVAFGRWDVRVGRDPSLAPPQPGLFDPVPLCAPGMLVGPDGFPADESPEGYPLGLPPGRILVDEPGHTWDIDVAALRAAKALFDDPEAIMAELLEILGRKSVRDYLRRDFFKDHLSRYSKSRRKAPIYWYLSVPSRDWGVWVYAPALSREMLFAVAGEAARRERLAGEAIARLHREQEAGGAGRSARAVIAELDAEARLAEELRRFGAEAERIAGLGWAPDLDDGIVLCAAPLADLFPAWPDAKKARDELRKGECTWATVARWAGRL